MNTRVDNFTATGKGTIVAVTDAPTSQYAIQVKGVAVGATSWTVLLEGSLDGVNFTTILTHNATDGSTVVSGSTLSPYLYFRSNCTALSLGSATSINVTILGK